MYCFYFERKQNTIAESEDKNDCKNMVVDANEEENEGTHMTKDSEDKNDSRGIDNKHK